MKKYIFALLLGVLVTGLAASPIFAEGDKVRGEEGEGSTIQACINFDGCPYGD